MLIRAGFEIAYDCPQPTPMLLALSVHPSRLPDVVGPHQITFDPPIGATEYRDAYGNICTRILAPPGRITMSSGFMVQDPGTPDAVVPEATQHAVQDLPDEVLVYLLGSRYCDTDRLSDTAWSLFGGTPVLGVSKPVIIGHGISHAKAFKNMIHLAVKMIDTDLLSKMKTSFTSS